MAWNNQTPLREFYDGCYRIHRHARGKHTVIEYQSTINNFERYALERHALDGVRLGDLTDDLVAGFQAWFVDRGRAPETANKNGATIKAIWNFAIDHNALKRKKRPNVRPLKKPKHERKTRTPEQFERLLAQTRRLVGVCGGVPARLWWPALLLTITNTGARLAAVMAAKRENLDLERCEILLPHQDQKQAADQWLPLLPDTIDALMLLRAKLPQDSEHLFPWQYDQAGTGYQTLRRHLRRILQAAGLPDSSKDLFHGQRAFTATMLTRAHGILAAQEQLGHSHISVTMGYIDKRQAGMSLDHAKLAAALPQLCGGRPPQPPAPAPIPPTPSEPAQPFTLRLFTGGDAVAG